ncbi:Cullin family-domain-containing protein [Boletus coccyginus]|nr:Cullin family-domain-containing protein [Boletus coccyginus]
MTDVLGKLFSLPKTQGFTAHRSSVVERTANHERLGSHPHKTPRLDHDSDSGSAYRSRDLKSKAVERDGPIVIQVRVLTPKAPSKPHPNPSTLLRCCTRLLLTRGSQSEMLPASFESIYTTCCSQVCIPGQGEKLYEMLVMETDQCNLHLRRELEAFRDIGNLGDWLEQFVQVCEWFESKVALLQSLLTYLDRAFILKDVKRQNIHDLAFTSFKRQILNDAPIVDCVRESVLQWLNRERTERSALHPLALLTPAHHCRSAHPNRKMIRNLVSHLLLHDMYAVIFERHVLEQTLLFYTIEASNKKLDLSAEQFLVHVTGRTSEERERAEAICGGVGETVKEIVQACRRGLLETRLDWLAKGAIGPLMNAQGTDLLRSIYAEFEALDSLGILCREFKSHIQTSVGNIIKDTEHEDDMVERILAFKTFADHTLQTSFVSSSAPNSSFSYALSDAFTFGFKARRNKPAELIARHLDKLMRHGQRGISDVEWESLLEKVLALYRFTDDKDVFRTFYMRALAKRLLLEKSASDDFEKGVLRILKERYDPEFGQGDHMFNDLALSREVLREFHNRIPETSSARKLSVMVLQRSVWPFAARKRDVDLHPSMHTDLLHYTTFYKAKHQATIKARFSAGNKDLTVSLYQAVVLLLFNDETEIGYRAVLEATRMDEPELKRTLQSLACANKKVLRKRPTGRDVHEDDVFYFNAEFTDPRAKVHINSIQAKDTPEESKRTQSHIDSDRKHYLDAAIVRIMKAKKELTYEALKTQTIDAVKNHFVPEVSVIKQRIAGLVEQEYLRRDDHDMNKFIYVA